MINLRDLDIDPYDYNEIIVDVTIIDDATKSSNQGSIDILIIHSYSSYDPSYTIEMIALDNVMKASATYDILLIAKEDDEILLNNLVIDITFSYYDENSRYYR